MANIREEIAQRFGTEVASDEKLLAECAFLDYYLLIASNQLYNRPKNLRNVWNHARGSPVEMGAATISLGPASRAREARRFTLDSLAGVRAQIKRDLEKGSGSAQRKTQVRSLASGVASINRNKMPFAFSRNMAQRVPVPDVQVKMELDMVTIPADQGPSAAGPSKVTFKGPQNDVASQKKRAYRYMFEKTRERGQILDLRIEEMAELEEVFVVGRITHELESPKLTEATLTLETSRKLSDNSGARISVRFDPALKIKGGAQGAGGLGLFPGAIVALKGQNGGAGWFSATEILALPLLTTSPSMKPSPDDDSFSMYIASGPFTPDTDLEYKPWNLFTQAARRAKPDVLVLIGPFVDTLHPLITAGEVDETPLDLFQRVFLEPLRDFLSWSPGSIAVLIPSVRDLISSHAVYPQAEFRKSVIKSDPRIRLVPNPCTFSVNGITFGATSIDVLFHLRKEEVIKRGQEVDSILPVFPEDSGSDPFGNACRHLLQQRSFYPIFPVPLDLMTEVNLDMTHSDGLKLDADVEDVAPSVLILPSRYRQFCKTVHTTMTINPSTLVKGVYSTINVSASSSGMTLKERLKAEVVKMEE
ncbi:hypothetical protein BT96DRAFT_992941 [Gymnopus androsaceus JB14]|uniref:DNA polymerase alpha subunit B n=1 Tax=Gymnopus androsaceus JB14 TaxID=1447944 RepID=A0A6A4HTZ0_9AGAR|nr:hypothetical protein BT96DRAFT_992941 [Gymnopus androsaceus JB14]